MDVKIGPQVKEVLEQYASAAEGVLDRCKMALGDTRTGQYTPQRLMSDVMASWYDIMCGLYYPMKWYEAARAEVVVAMAVDPASARAVGAIAIAEPASTTLTVAPLTTKDAIPKTLTATAYVAEGAPKILVVVIDLATQSAKTGTYRGTVIDATGAVVARVEATVP